MAAEHPSHVQLLKDETVIFFEDLLDQLVLKVFALSADVEVKSG
jgi:hypothetical protein